MKQILFLTSTNLASNPRCRKEIELAQELGYTVTVYAFDMANWTREKEQQIRNKLNGIRYHSLQTSRKPLMPWLINALLGKGAKLLYKMGWRSTLINAVVTDRRTLALNRALNKVKASYDLVVAHNPGAFYPAWHFSRKTDIPFAIDVEDYHPWENNGPMVRHAVAELMKAILPHAAYTSFASPMIGDATLSLFSGNRLKKTFTVNNVFSSKEFSPVQTNAVAEEKMKMVWFSQHISFNRGLDEILPLLKPFSERITLTLIGNLDHGFYEAVLKKYGFIEIKAPMGQEALNQAISFFDIGLALEVGTEDENRNICLTNKIWTYLQAGLYILASNTPAQVQFAQLYPDHTSIINIDNKDATVSEILKMLDALPAIRQGRIARSKVNQTISWEVENKKLVQQWQNLIGS